MIRRPVSPDLETPVSSPRRGAARQRPATPKPKPERPSGDVRRAAATWIADGKAQGWSAATIRDREQALERFCWWLENEAKCGVGLAELSPTRVREFLAYTRDPCPTGRYGSDRPSAKKEARPATVNAYFRIIRALTNFCLEEGLLHETPLKNVTEPKIPKDQIQPFTDDQVELLLNGARRSSNPERDAAVIGLLIDTGMREGEIEKLTLSQVKQSSGDLEVTGKGNKKRTVHMGVKARRMLWRHIEVNRRDALPEEPLFVSTGGNTPGLALTHAGFHRIVEEAGRRGRVTDVRCSPHTCRHTFAISFLRNGGNLFQLQELMGHESPETLRRYVKYAEQDLRSAHRQASPMDRMGGK